VVHHHVTAPGARLVVRGREGLVRRLILDEVDVDVGGHTPGTCDVTQPERVPPDGVAAVKEGDEVVNARHDGKSRGRVGQTRSSCTPTSPNNAKITRAARGLFRWRFLGRVGTRYRLANLRYAATNRSGRKALLFSGPDVSSPTLLGHQPSSLFTHGVHFPHPRPCLVQQPVKPAMLAHLQHWMRSQRRLAL